MVIALVSGVLLTRSRQQRLGLAWFQRLAIGAGAFCGGMIGSKIPFALTDSHGPFCAQAWFTDGKTLLFGLVGGYLGVELAKHFSGVKTKTGDSFAVPVAISIAIGRVACFVAGCCYGIPTSVRWGVDFGDGVRRHPTQLYEVVFHLLAALALVMLERQNRLPTQRFKLYLIAYCIFRFLTEFLRPEVRMTLGLTVYQWGTVLMTPLIGLLWWHDEHLLRPSSQTSIDSPFTVRDSS